MQDSITSYAKQVVQHPKLYCWTVVQTCKKHLDELKQSQQKDFPYYFDIQTAEIYIQFFSLLKHYKGPSAGKNFILEPWQKFIIGSVFGWKRKSDHLRRFKYVYIEIPRKNGKSILSAGILLATLILDQESGYEGYTLATKQDQAKIVWSDADVLAKSCSTLKKKLNFKQNLIEYPLLHGTIKPLASESRKLDGLNTHVAIFDEFHANSDQNLFDVIDGSTGARTQPLVVMITTAGFNTAGVCYKWHGDCKAILDGQFKDDKVFSYISTLNKDDDPFDEKSWFKSNPNLGVSKSLDFMREQATQAQRSESKRRTFLTKQLCVWTSGEGGFFNMIQWNKGHQQFDVQQLQGRECYAGLDLGSVKDITALVLLFPPVSDNDKYIILPHFWVPEDGVQKRETEDKLPYYDWIAKGDLLTTKGNVTDYNVIYEKVIELNQLYHIRELAYDRWQATSTVLKLQEEGLQVIEFAQTLKNFNEPLKHLEALVEANSIIHNNEVLSWMAGNVAIFQDGNGNIKPDKKKSRDKIDGIVALLMAYGRYLINKQLEDAGIAGKNDGRFSGVYFL